MHKATAPLYRTKGIGIRDREGSQKLDVFQLDFFFFINSFTIFLFFLFRHFLLGLLSRTQLTLPFSSIRTCTVGLDIKILKSKSDSWNRVSTDGDLIRKIYIAIVNIRAVHSLMFQMKFSNFLTIRRVHLAFVQKRFWYLWTGVYVYSLYLVKMAIDTQAMVHIGRCRNEKFTIPYKYQATGYFCTCPLFSLFFSFFFEFVVI